MANMRDIRRRIKSVVSTQKITKAMKMVSAAKLRKTQSTLVAVRPYSLSSALHLQPFSIMYSIAHTKS